MSFIDVAVGVIAAGTVYSAVKSNQAAKAQRNAVLGQQKQDAIDQAKAEGDAANEANAARIAQKRAYQANALALGGTDDTLGAPGSNQSGGVLGGGAQTNGANSGGGTTVLGGGGTGGGGSGYGSGVGGGGSNRYRGAQRVLA